MKVLVPLLLSLAVLAEAHAGDVTLFDADPAHPWNRLYAALYGETSASQPREPRTAAKWDEPDERLAGKEYTDLLAELDAFLGKHAERLSTSPPRRALLQSALWATFDQVSDPRGVERAPRIAIARRCAEIIRRLALSDAEIDSLPDNYASTVKSGVFPADYDTAQRERVFLPPGMLDSKGPWVMLLSGFDRSPAAIQHVQAVQGRSAFYVLIKLPAGRDATLRYLRTLAAYPQPYVWNEYYAPYPYARSPMQPNPDLPQFPQGTQVALMRRMLLVNSRDELVVTHVTQSLQMRVYAKDPKQATAGELENQDFFEFKLSTGGFFANQGGLLAHDRQQAEAPMKFEEQSMFLRGACNDCHGKIGIHSVNTYTHSFGPPRSTPWFEPATQEYQDRYTLEWKKRDYSWGLLQGFFAAMPASANRH